MTIIATSAATGMIVLAQSIATAAYIVAALLFILALAGLSKQESARRGIVYGIAGMTIALVATVILVLAEGALTGGATLGIVLLVAGADTSPAAVEPVRLVGLERLTGLVLGFQPFPPVLLHLVDFALGDDALGDQLF